jgi:hypothetical protein
MYVNHYVFILHFWVLQFDDLRMSRSSSHRGTSSRARARTGEPHQLRVAGMPRRSPRRSRATPGRGRRADPGTAMGHFRRALATASVCHAEHIKRRGGGVWREEGGELTMNERRAGPGELQARLRGRDGARRRVSGLLTLRRTRRGRIAGAACSGRGHAQHGGERVSGTAMRLNCKGLEDQAMWRAMVEWGPVFLGVRQARG